MSWRHSRIITIGEALSDIDQGAPAASKRYAYPYLPYFVHDIQKIHEMVAGIRIDR